MDNKELIKAQLQQSKTAIEQKTIDFVTENGATKINLQLSQQINEIVYNGTTLDNELIVAINQAVATAKMGFEKEMYQILSGLGIKM